MQPLTSRDPLLFVGLHNLNKVAVVAVAFHNAAIISLLLKQKGIVTLWAFLAYRHLPQDKLALGIAVTGIKRLSFS